LASGEDSDQVGQTIEAEVQYGVVNVTFLKAEKAKPRRISVT
jgi:HSP20 family molecular chaperone IbpA